MRWTKNLLLATGVVCLAGCAQEPPYFGPVGPGHDTGYTDQQLDPTHFRITYSGNSSTPRITVEDFLLLRSAQVALQAGYPYFLFDTRDTKSKTSYYSTFEGWPGWGGFGGYGWFGPPGWPNAGDAETRPITRYEAYAEIVVLSEVQAQKEPRALNAQAVIDHLGPSAAPPPPGH